MKKVTYTDKYTGKSFSEYVDMTEKDREELRKKAEKKLQMKMKAKKAREEYMASLKSGGVI